MTATNPYRDRRAGGQALARLLARYGGRPDTVVLGLPRGGLPVAFEVARFLHAPLDVFGVRRLVLERCSARPLGILATGGVRLLHEDVLREERVGPGELGELLARETAELRRLEALHRSARPGLNLAGRLVLLVDDGLATGATANAALHALAAHRPARVVVGVPVGEPDACAAMLSQVDEFVCPMRPDPFFAVGCWYDHFPELTDEDVRECLGQAWGAVAAGERSGVPARRF